MKHLRVILNNDRILHFVLSFDFGGFKIPYQIENRNITIAALYHIIRYIKVNWKRIENCKQSKFEMRSLIFNTSVARIFSKM